MKELGFGVLGLKPCEFWDLTIFQINELAMAERFRCQLRREDAAWEVAYITSPHLKKPMQVAKIAPRPAKRGKRIPEEERQDLLAHIFEEDRKLREQGKLNAT